MNNAQKIMLIGGVMAAMGQTVRHDNQNLCRSLVNEDQWHDPERVERAKQKREMRNAKRLKNLAKNKKIG